MTSFLPRMCSTTELCGLVSYLANRRQSISILVDRIRWAEEDSNLRRQCQLIYSQPRLATSVSAHILCISSKRHSLFPRNDKPNHLTNIIEADDGNRTRNLPLTRRLLCRLSYVGKQNLNVLKLRIAHGRTRALYQMGQSAARLATFRLPTKSKSNRIQNKRQWSNKRIGALPRQNRGLPNRQQRH